MLANDSKHNWDSKLRDFAMDKKHIILSLHSSDCGTSLCLLKLLITCFGIQVLVHELFAVILKCMKSMSSNKFELLTSSF